MAQVSSVRQAGSPSHPARPSLTLYSYTNYRSIEFYITRDWPNLGVFNDQAYSAILTGSQPWTVYTLVLLWIRIWFPCSMGKLIGFLTRLLSQNVYCVFFLVWLCPVQYFLVILIAICSKVQAEIQNNAILWILVSYCIKISEHC